MKNQRSNNLIGQNTLWAKVLNGTGDIGQWDSPLWFPFSSRLLTHDAVFRCLYWLFRRIMSRERNVRLISSTRRLPTAKLWRLPWWASRDIGSRGVVYQEWIKWAHYLRYSSLNPWSDTFFLNVRCSRNGKYHARANMAAKKVLQPATLWSTGSISGIKPQCAARYMNIYILLPFSSSLRGL